LDAIESSALRRFVIAESVDVGSVGVGVGVAWSDI
jgi:hypothetical protein